jgi:hypothetical protein
MNVIKKQKVIEIVGLAEVIRQPLAAQHSHY